MALPLPVPVRQDLPSMDKYRQSRSHPHHRITSPATSNFDLFSSFSSASFGSSCALTILKGDAEQPISAHAPIHQKAEGPSLPSFPRSRFASTFASPRSTNDPNKHTDTSVNVHAVADDGILLPFLDRPTEVRELLFETKANESLMYRLCRIFGGRVDQATSRGIDERWDEMLELLIDTNRPILDDEDWLVRLESLVMERSPELWAQLSRCLGAEGLTFNTTQSSLSRFDSWAFPHRHNSLDVSEEVSSSAQSSSEGGRIDDAAISVSVEPLEDLPSTFSEQPAGKIQQPSTRERRSPSSSSSELLDAHHDTLSPGGGVFAMSHADAGAAATSLADILEEPGSSAAPSQPLPQRKRSHSGKFAGLRISAMTPSSPTTSRRSSEVSATRPSVVDGSVSPMPTGLMSPTDGQFSNAHTHAPESPGSPSSKPSTSFTKHRRLSTMIVHNHHTHDHNASAASPRTTMARQLRRPSDFSHDDGQSTAPRATRRRAESFARSFAELTSPMELLQQLQAEEKETEQLAEQTRRYVSLQESSAPFSPTSAPAGPVGGLGLQGESFSKNLDPISASVTEGNIPSSGRKRSESRVSARSTSPPMVGLLPDGRTRHPSGSCGSRDLSESIAAFRATMGMSTSPVASERNFSEADEATSADVTAADIASMGRKRKGMGAELPKTSPPATEACEAKVSRLHSPKTQDQPVPSPKTQNQPAAGFEQPKHMQKLETKQKAVGGGTGLALGGGFSLAKPGSNFRRQSADATPLAAGSSRPNVGRSGSSKTGDYFPYRSPPPVHRRPGGFVSLAQEYESARRQRRATSESVFSMHSNALDSSPSSSVASFDTAGASARQNAHDTPRDLSPEEPTTRLHEHRSFESAKHPAVPAIVATEPTPRGTPGGITPRASFGANSRMAHKACDEYPFPAPIPPPILIENEATSPDTSVPTSVEMPGSADVSLPITPSEELKGRHLTVSGLPASCFGPRSPTIVFPISPNPSISRARELQKALDTPSCREAFAKITEVRSAAEAQFIRELIISTERSQMPDEVLLEVIGKRLGLVDHERAHQNGGKEAEQADIALAEEGYAQRWDAFADLCRALGVGHHELSTAKRRCGPAIDLSGH